MASSFGGEVPKTESPDPTQVRPRSPPLSLLEHCRNEPATFVAESPLNTIPTKHPQVEASGRACNAQAGENIASPPPPVTTAVSGRTAASLIQGAVVRVANKQ